MYAQCCRCAPLRAVGRSRRLSRRPKLVGALHGVFCNRPPFGETTVSAVYLVALVGVGVSILWLAIDAVISVSRKPRWETLAPRTLTLVKSEERRTQSMPFIGAD